MVPFSFHGEEMRLTSSRALHWPREQALLVADLHLEKASYYGRGGQMLPPYDSRETLERLALAVRETGARRIFALGDSFHDEHGPQRLDPYAAGMLAALTRALDWVWITGNHDSQAARHPGGTITGEQTLSGIVLRHQAEPGGSAAEISGHFHPRLTINARGRRISRPCTVRSLARNGPERLILPAFGTLAGGMDAADPAIVSALQPADTIDALLPASGQLVQYPLWRAAA